MQLKRGPVYTPSPEGFTFEDVERTIAALNAEMPGHTFMTEPITEGGIQLIEWPGKKPKGYKSLRLGIGNWPWLPRPPDAEAHNLKLESCTVHPDEFCTVLKAFDGAPGWTPQELSAIKQCMEKEMRVTFGRKRKR